MKLQYFDKEVIRTLMEGSTTLEKGISYCKRTTPGCSDEVAKETAIRLAQEYCQRKWLNDSSGYISNEYIAFREFESDVRNDRYFSSQLTPEEKKRADAEKTNHEKEENNKKRIEALKEHCRTNNLNFDEENIKQLTALRKKDRIANLLCVFGFLGLIAAGICLFAVGFWTAVIVAVIAFIILCVGGGLNPMLPDNVYDVLKNKK